MVASPICIRNEGARGSHGPRSQCVGAYLRYRACPAKLGRSHETEIRADVESSALPAQAGYRGRECEPSSLTVRDVSSLFADVGPRGARCLLYLCACRVLARGPLPVPGCGACFPARLRYLFGTRSVESGGGTGSRRWGSSRGRSPTSGKSNICERISRAITSANKLGTALPSCFCAARRSPEIITSSGNVCRRHSSRALRWRLRQWKGPVAGPGCA